MEKIINYDNLRWFAYSNDRLIQGKIRGVVLMFSGLGSVNMNDTDPPNALEWAKQDILYVRPYYNPWCWMNRQTVAYVDEILEVLAEKYQLDRKTLKVVSTGMSMGGLCALVYCAYAGITPCACVADCPVCDLPYHFTERPDLPKTLYSAFGAYDGTLEDALKTCSPMHLASKLPDIPYSIFCCQEDRLVDPEKHGYALARKLEKTHRIHLVTVPQREHCDLSTEAREAYDEAIRTAISGE